MTLFRLKFLRLTPPPCRWPQRWSSILYDRGHPSLYTLQTIYLRRHMKGILPTKRNPLSFMNSGPGFGGRGVLPRQTCYGGDRKL